MKRLGGGRKLCMAGSTSGRAFTGFPTRGRFTPVHNVFFTAVLPHIGDVAELRVTLHVFWALYQKKGYPRFVTAKELLADAALVQGLGSETGAPAALASALQAAAERGTLLRLHVARDGREEDLYFLNTDADRRAVERIGGGELSLPSSDAPGKSPAALPETRNIFSLYEAHIGMLTPMIAEDLKEAEKLYPADWVEDAFREAVEHNKRSWRYIARILERWSAEGKDNGKPERHTKKTDPDKYFRGKYGHLVKRR